MAKAIDIGTSFIVGAEIKDGREVFTTERDAFFSMPKEDFAEEMLNDAGAYYITKADQIYVVGEDALKFAMLTANQKAYRRPMAKGVLNPGEEEAISMLELLIEGIIGHASFPGEVCAATCPAEPIDQPADITFHRILIERCLKRLGYEPKILNEALAIVFHENPTAETSEGEAVPFTGVGVSFGAGMTNLVVAWRAKKLFEMSVARGGDWIDEHVAAVRGTNASKVCSIKEKKLDLRRIEPRDSIQVALEIYHEDLIRYTLQQFGERFRTSESVIDEPLEWVVGGGTAMVPGFIEKLKAQIANMDLPFPVKGVRLAPDPLKCVAAGALVAAISYEKKRGKKDDEEVPLPPAERLGHRSESSESPAPLFRTAAAARAAAAAGAGAGAPDNDGAQARTSGNGQADARKAAGEKPRLK